MTRSFWNSSGAERPGSCRRGNSGKQSFRHDRFAGLLRRRALLAARARIGRSRAAAGAAAPRAFPRPQAAVGIATFPLIAAQAMHQLARLAEEAAALSAQAAMRRSAAGRGAVVMAAAVPILGVGRLLAGGCSLAAAFGLGGMPQSRAADEGRHQHCRESGKHEPVQGFIPEGAKGARPGKSARSGPRRSLSRLSWYRHPPRGTSPVMPVFRRIQARPTRLKAARFEAAPEELPSFQKIHPLPVRTLAVALVNARPGVEGILPAIRIGNAP